MKHLILAASLAVASVVAGPALADGHKNTLHFARYDGSKLIDPIYARRNPDIWMVGSLFDTLLRPSADGNSVEPGLATDWSTSENGKTITLTLRDNVKFSDGTALTGEDIVFSLDRARNKELGPWAGLLGNIDKVSHKGQVITINLSKPDPTLFSILATFNTAIVSKNKFMQANGNTDQEKSANLFATAKPGLGSGPFFMSAFAQGNSMEFTANPHYWLKDGEGKQLPYLNKIDFQVIPDDATRILKLQAGEVDAAEFIPFSRVAELQSDSKLHMNLYPSTRIIYAPINTRPTRKDGSKNPLADQRVRQALNYATNKQALIGLVLQGSGKPMTSPLMAAATQYSKDFGPLYNYDLEKAKQLIKEAGLKKGTKITLTTLAGSADDATIFAALQQMWAPLGIDLVVEQVDGATRGAKNRSGDFDIHTYGWVNDVNDPSQVVGWLGYTPTANSVGTGWQNDQFNKLFEASGAEMDPAKRQQQFAEMQKIYADAAPLLFMYETPFAVAISKSVVNYQQTPLGNNIFERTSLQK